MLVIADHDVYMQLKNINFVYDPGDAIIKYS